MSTSQRLGIHTDIAVLADLHAPVAQLLRTMRDEALAIQERQSPSAFLQVRELECHCQHRRASIPGGDFFDLAVAGPDELSLGIGTLPVSGISGPILISGLQTTLHSLSVRGSDLPGILGELNQIMWNIAPERTFASLFSARIVTHTRRLYYVNAGHEAALLLRNEGRIERLEPHAPILGLSRRSAYHQRSVRFEPGDTLIALTEGAEAGAARVLRTTDLETIRFRDLPDLINDAAESLAGPASLDRTVVVVHYDRTESRDLHRLAAVPLAELQKSLAAAA